MGNSTLKIYDQRLTSDEGIAMTARSKTFRVGADFANAKSQYLARSADGATAPFIQQKTTIL